MALGLSPKHEQTLNFEGFNNRQFLPLAVGVVKQLGWMVSAISETRFIAYIPASDDLPGEEFRVMVWDGLATIKSESPGNQMVDWGKNKKNIAAFVKQFDLAKSSADPETLEQQYRELHMGANPTAPGFPATNKLSDILTIFRPVNGYFATPIIAGLNILVFMVMVMAGAGFWSADGQTLVSWGADYQPLAINGEWWRLVTSMFLHDGFMHLLGNMIALVYIGVSLEPHLGKLRFFAAYFVTGIAASLTSILWHEGAVSVGASGAIFGLCGVFLAMLTTNFIERSAKKHMLIGLSLFVAWGLIDGGFEKGIDNAAHVGGLVCGLLMGYAYYPSLKKPGAAALQRLTVSGASIVILLICWLLFRDIPNDMGTYEKKIKEFALMEKRALKVYDLPKNSPKDSLLAKLQNPGVYYWRKCVNLLDSLDDLHLPSNIRERNQMLKRYCTLYIGSYQLTFKAVFYNTDMFKDSDMYYRKNIRAVADSLKAF
jgi:rhomboid protease GluP